MKLLELFIDVTVRGNRAVAGLQRVRGEADRAEMSLAGVGRGAFAAIGNFAAMAGGAYAAGRAIGATIRAGAEFEKQMNSVNAVARGMGATDEQLAGLQAKARDLGRNTAFSATQSAAAIEMLLKNGVSAEKVLGGMADASLTLAAAMGKEIAPTADFLTDVMAQFSLEANDASNAIDIIAGASVASKFDMDDLAQAFSKAGAQANSVGIDLEEYAAIISLVSSNFTSGELAGTAFRGFLTKLAGVTGPAKTRMRELGVEFFKANGELKELPEILTELNDGFGDLSDEARTQAISEIFGLETMPFVNALLGKTGEELQNVRDQIAGVSAQDLKNEKWKGLSAAFVEFNSALESLMITISGSGLNEWLESAVRGLTGVVRGIENWISNNPELIKTIQEIITSIGPWVAALIGIMVTLGTVRFAFGLFFKSTLARMGIWVGAMIAKVALLVAEMMGASALLDRLGLGSGARRETGGRNTGGRASRGNRNQDQGGGSSLNPLVYTPHVAVPYIAGQVMEPHKDAIDRFMANELRWVTKGMSFLGYQQADDLLARTDLIAGANANAQQNSTTNVTIGDIVVNAETNADPNEIGQIARDEVERLFNGPMLEANN